MRVRNGATSSLSLGETVAAAARVFLGDRRTVLAAVFLFGVTVAFLYRPLNQIVVGDAAIWDYIAQAITRGQVPYRDVVEIKSPGSAYLSAMAMQAGGLFGLSDFIAPRLLQIALAGLLMVVTYLVTETYLRSGEAALISAVAVWLSGHFGEWVVEGTQPKLSMILFGMLSLLAVARQKPVWAGFLSMMSCLCWQPGLLFTGTAFLIFSRYFSSWKDLAALKVAAGAAIPLAAAILYFYSEAALSEFWTWTVTYNYSVYGPESARSFMKALSQVGRVFYRVFGVGVVVVAVSFVGMAAFAIRQARAGTLTRREPFLDALFIAPLIYLAFCVIDLQGGPDLIPLVPFIGIFLGLSVIETARLVGRSAPRWIPKAATLILCLVVIGRAVTYRVEGGTLADQRREFAVIGAMLGPEDTIYVHGAVEVLVLLRRPNANPFIMWDKLKDEFIASQWYGGRFESVVEELEMKPPKLVVLSRMTQMKYRTKLEQWVKAKYERFPLGLGYEDVYVRKRG